MIDPVAIDQAEASIEQFIEKRAQQGRAEREREGLWQASVRRYNGQRRQENISAWLEYHSSMARGHEKALQDIVAYHLAERDRFARLLEDEVA